MPQIGFGTWEVAPDEAAKRAVANALEVGYRIVDTAKIYGNEQGVGEAIRESGIPREDLFITTKLWNDDQGYDRTLKACQKSLDKLGLDYLDLYLIHWPATSKRHDSWRAFEQLHKDGLIKATGVSNYTIDHLEDLATRSQLTPSVNQVELHPFIYEEQKSLLKYCRQQNILIEAYSPLNRISSGSDGVVENLANKLGKTPQQLALRWCIQHGTLPLPRSTNPDHTRSNFKALDFELNSKDMQALDSLSDGERVTWDPANMG